MTSPLLNTRQHVWVPRVLADDHKRIPRVTVGLAPSLLNGHKCRVQVQLCSPSPVMVTPPYEWKILSSGTISHKQTNQVLFSLANRKMLGKFNFLCSFHIWVSFLKIYGFNDYNKFWFLACEQLTLSVHNMSSFRGFRKIILGVIRKWSFEAALNFESYLSDWHFSLTLFTAVFISNSASDGE